MVNVRIDCLLAVVVNLLLPMGKPESGQQPAFVNDRCWASNWFGQQR